MNLGVFITGVYCGLLAGIAFGAYIALKWHADDNVKPAATGRMARVMRADATNYRGN